MNRFLLLATLTLMSTSPSPAEPGKWTPQQILEIDLARLASWGLQVPPTELWRPEGGGLLEAAVQISGCSAGFISPDGLLVTNHHCVFSILQEHATPARDLIHDGFLAKSREEELPGTGVRVTVPHKLTDVTAEIEKAAAGAADDFARFQAIDRKKKELVAACEAQPFRRCQVAVYNDGVRYELIEALEFSDVRLVWAPPRALGEYGGEVDNWSWPRHTADFALARVWAADGKNPAPHAAENQPYHPSRFFPISLSGVRDGDLVMVAGFPGYTVRGMTAPEMAEVAERYFPARAALYRRWLDLMDAAMAADREASIALADRAKSLANREKNARGQVAGIARGQILAHQRAADEAVREAAASRPELELAVAAYREIGERHAARMATWDHDFLLRETKSGARPLALAITLSRWALEREKPDLEREEDYQERNRNRLLDELRRDQKRLHPATEVQLMVDLLHRFENLPASQRSTASDSFLGPDPTLDKIASKVKAALAATRVLDLPSREAMFGETVSQLHARKDPLLELGFAFNQEILAFERQDKAWKGALSRLRPLWWRAQAAVNDGPVAFDANSTFRVSFGHVGGYSPRDGVWMKPQTTLFGLVEKHTGEEPFNAPEAVRAAAATAASSRWADPTLHDLPLCFLASADTTGGNSGSPVLNARGELVGVNFDRVWENVANDFGYNPAVARNITADVRFLLWYLETLEGERARGLLAELGVR